MTSLNYDQCFLDAFIGVNATDVEQWAESFYADVGAAVPKAGHACRARPRRSRWVDTPRRAK